MFVPFNVDVPMARLPVANWVLIVATALITVHDWVNPPPAGGHSSSTPPQYRHLEQIVRRPPSSLALHRDPQQFAFRQLLTYVLVHLGLVQGGPIHLIGNMGFLFCFGNAVNAKLGHVLFLALYFLSGMVAGLAWLLVGHGPTLTGAAGAIMGIVGAFLVLYPRTDVRFVRGGFGRFHTFEVSSFWVILLALASNLVGTLASPYGGIAYLCHLAACLFGVAVTVVLVLIGWIKSEEHEENALEALGLVRASRREGIMNVRDRDIRSRR